MQKLMRQYWKNRASTMHELEKEITISELDKALNSMSNGKFSGLDGIPGEIYKSLGDN